MGGLLHQNINDITANTYGIHRARSTPNIIRLVNGIFSVQ
jgi:hypothetical protein